MVRRHAAMTTLFALNLAPMVDVMMCLLIFFMVATRLAAQRPGLVSLPEARTAGQVDRSGGASDLTITISSGASGPDYWLSGEAMPLRELESALAERVASGSSPTCDIRADRALPYGVVKPVLAACSRLGIDRVRFSAARPAGEEPG